MSRFCIFALIVPALVFGVLSFGRTQDVKKAAGQADLNTLVHGNNEFAFDLYGRLAKKDGNIVFSPYSISTALALTYGGARGGTADAMAKALHFGLPQERLHPAFADLNSGLRKSNKATANEFHIANALWGQKGCAFRPEFLELVDKHYEGGLHLVDFARDSDQARAVINRWVELQTKDKIKDLLPGGSLGSDVRLVLANAVYLNAKWKAPFAKDRTKDAPFHASATQKVIVPMMVMVEKKESDEGPTFNYFEDDVWQWLELPYQGDKMSMVLVLPRKKGDLPNTEKKLTAAAVQKSLTELGRRAGAIVLPRFHFAADVDLLAHLKKMGMQTGPLTAIASNEEQFISDIFHKAYIKVDEAGTEAAAATGTVVRAISRDPPPFRFYADHPFLFLIRDTHTGTILFLGRVSDPSKS